MKERFLEFLEKVSITINSIENALQINDNRKMIFGVLILVYEIGLFLIGNYYSNKKDELDKARGKNCYKIMVFCLIVSAFIMQLM